MRIVQIASTEFDGGAEIYISNLARGISASGNEVKLLGHLKTWPTGFPKPERFGKINKWNLRRLPLAILRLPFEKARLKSRLSDADDVYHSHFKREQIGSTYLLNRTAPVVWTEHGLFPRGLFGIAIRPLYRRASRSASRIICVSDIVKRDIDRVLKGRGPTVVIDTGVRLREVPNEADRHKARAQFGLRPDQRVCCVVGRLTAGKRPELAIGAARAAGFEVLVAGGGPLDTILRKDFGNDPSVHFLGQVADSYPVFLASDVNLFCSTGDGEGMPLVLLEASAACTPTVSVSDSPFGVVVTQSGGMIAPPHCNELASKIKATADSSSTRGASSRKWASDRGEKRWLDTHLLLYREVELEYRNARKSAE